MQFSHQLGREKKSGTSPFFRREFLADSATGLGGIALAWLLASQTQGEPRGDTRALRPPFAPKARRVIQLFMNDPGTEGIVMDVKVFSRRDRLSRIARGEFRHRDRARGRRRHDGTLTDSSQSLSRDIMKDCRAFAA